MINIFTRLWVKPEVKEPSKVKQFELYSCLEIVLKGDKRDNPSIYLRIKMEKRNHEGWDQFLTWYKSNKGNYYQINVADGDIEIVQRNQIKFVRVFFDKE